MKKRGFTQLLDKIRTEFSTPTYSKAARFQVLLSLDRLNISDPEILKQTEDLIVQ
jgi:hypothetical protein